MKQNVSRRKPRVLDVTCGGRMMWFDKLNDDAWFCDERKEYAGFLSQRPNFEVLPDEVCDFTDLPFDDESFYLIVFDPPHRKTSKSSIIGKKYGSLKDEWKNEIKRGFTECFRVLKTNGVLVFKWGEQTVHVSEVIKLSPKKPLFGHTTAKSGKTKWMTFIK